MKRCPECKTFKKADNCIKCYRMMKQKYDRHIKKLQSILQGVGDYRVKEEIEKLLDEEIVR